MPSMLPLLSYANPFEDESCSASNLPPSMGGEEDLSQPTSSKIVGGVSRIEISSKEGKQSNIPNSVERKGNLIKPANSKIVSLGSRMEISSKEGKKSGKKKRRPAGNVSRRKENSSNNDEHANANVEEMVRKATAHAAAGQAVKKAVLEIQLLLLDGVRENCQLQGSWPLLTQSEYSDVVTERSIAKRCGYPLCRNGLVAEKNRKGRFRISLREHKVYDLRLTELFCCGNCLVASKTFQSSLQIDREGYMGKEKLMVVVDSVREPKLSQCNMDSTNHQDHVQSNNSIVSGIQERLEFGNCSFDDAGPFDAIEGYVPQSNARHFNVNKIAQQSNDSPKNQLECKTELHCELNDPACPILSSKETSTDVETSICDELDEAEIAQVPPLKSALKKENIVSILKRSVSWKDQIKKDRASVRKDENLSPRLKTRSKVSHKTATLTEDQMKKDRKPGTELPEVCTQAHETATLIQDLVKKDRKLETKVQNVSTQLNEHSRPCNFDPASSSVVSSNAVDIERNVSSTVILLDAGNSESNPSLPISNLETDTSERFLAAKAVATALTEAADAASVGEIDCVEAVSKVGISIIPVSGNVEKSIPVKEANELSRDGRKKESGSSVKTSAEKDRTGPLPESPEEDLDFTAAGFSWHDAPPRELKVELSLFGKIWMALEEWVSAATIAHIYGWDPNDDAEYLIANGKEYRMRKIAPDGISTEISKTFANCIARAFPGVVETLQLHVPVSTLEYSIGRLIRTMSFIEPLPAFGANEWRMVLILLLDGLSVHQLPVIGVHLAHNMALVDKAVDSTGTSKDEYVAFRDLLLPHGRLSTLSSTGKS